MRTRASALLLLAAAYCPAQKPARPKTPPPYATYHSDALGLDFAYPSNFRRPDGASEDGPGKPDRGCASVPLAVIDMSAGLNMIFLRRYDPFCSKRRRRKAAAEPKVQAATFLRDSLTGFGRPSLGSPANYDLAGHDASTVFGRVKLARGIGTTEIYGAESCAVAGRNIACFEFLSDDCNKVAALAASTVKFMAGAATPVLPARLVPACKP